MSGIFNSQRMKSIGRVALIAASISIATPGVSIAQSGPSADALENSLIHDWNGDGELRLMAFGDSLTRGVGDFTAPGVEIHETADIFFPGPSQEAGYPLRLENWTGLSVQNYGDPGESLVSGNGVYRFANSIQQVRPDVVVFYEGSNDAVFQKSSTEYFFRLQSVVNMARAVGAHPVIATVPVPTENHSGSAPFVSSYNGMVKRVAQFGSLPYADLSRAFQNSCDYPDCDLYNFPEGLHPNTRGYDLIAENIAATLFQIDIFAADGAAQLETALGLPAGTVITKPDPAVAAPTEES